MNDDTGVASLRRYERCSGSSGMISTLLLAMQFIYRGTNVPEEKALANIRIPAAMPIVRWTLPFSDPCLQASSQSCPQRKLPVEVRLGQRQLQWTLLHLLKNWDLLTCLTVMVQRKARLGPENAGSI
jgi:hypothetical protein